MTFAGIEQDDIVRSMLRDKGRDGFCKVPVRIDQTDASTSQHVGDDHVLDQRRLSHAGLPDHIQMPPQVFQSQYHRSPIIPEQNPPQHHRSLFFF